MRIFSWYTAAYFASSWKFIPKTPVRKVRGRNTVAKSERIICDIDKGKCVIDAAVGTSGISRDEPYWVIYRLKVTPVLLSLI
jgi:hypothetical protein